MAMIFSNAWVFANLRTNVDGSQTLKINYGCCISSLLWIQRTSLHSASQYHITLTNHTSEKFKIETLRKIDTRKQLPSFLSFQKVMSDTDVLAHIHCRVWENGNGLKPCCQKPRLTLFHWSHSSWQCVKVSWLNFHSFSTICFHFKF